MTPRINVTIDCREPERLARFWRALLGYQDRPVPPGYASWEEHDRDNGVPESELDAGSAAEDPTGAGPRLFFQRVPESKTVKNRVHLDIEVSGELDPERSAAAIRAEIERAESHGALLVRVNEDDEDYFAVLVDPEGNEFCLT